LTIRFAHMADVHLGAFRDERLRELNMRAFEEALSICAQEELDFILISGDLFHVNLPDMGIADRAVRGIRDLKQKGIRFYMIYGSHDYSTGGSCLIDVLDSADLFTKITKASTEEDEAPGPDDKKGKDDKVGEKIILDFIEDKSGALLCGMPGRKSSLEKKYYEMLDTTNLEKRKGFKVFAFHSAITEFRPDYLPEGDSIPLSLFPKGFDYYAGGHIHERFIKQESNHGTIAYPGALFGYDYTDLERGSKDKRGFYIVEHDLKTGKTTTEFKEVKLADIKIVDVDVDGIDQQAANQKLRSIVGSVKAAEAVVLMKVHGQLTGGRPSDVNIQEASDGLDASGAAAVFINRNQLKGAELEKIRVETGPREGIEAKVFNEYLLKFDSPDARFKGENGLGLSKELLEIARAPRPEGRTKSDHEKGLLKKAMPLFAKKDSEPKAAPKNEGGDA
jgi:DNA repair protein SbcD/Mre11